MSMTEHERREWLTAIINSPDEKLTDRLKAAELLNKMDFERARQESLQGNTNATLRITWQAPISEPISESISEGVVAHEEAECVSDGETV